MDGQLDSPDGVIDRSIREQNRFLDHCVMHAILVTIFLSSGAHFIGVVVEHDRKCLLLGGKSISRPTLPRMFMKSYIALIRPNEAIELFIQYRGMGTALKRKKALRKARKKAFKGKLNLIPGNPCTAMLTNGNRHPPQERYPSYSKRP
jgi:sRNA-binding regulator protein Hfq